MKEKLKAFAQLPQHEYGAVAKLIMEDLKETESEWNSYLSNYRIEMGSKFMETISNIAASGTTRTYSIGDTDFIVSVTQTKTKK